MQLVACEGCRRHVSIGERACPFCGVPTDTASRRVRPLLGKVSRAAVFAAGASATACWTANTPATTSGSGGGGGTTITNHGSAAQVDGFEVPAPSTGFASMGGICTDSANGQPLADANVRIYPDSGPGARMVKSDAQGRWVAKDLAPGKYSIQMVAPGDPGRMAPPAQYVELKAGDAKRVDGTVLVQDWSNMPMPYGAPPSRRRVV